MKVTPCIDVYKNLNIEIQEKTSISPCCLYPPNPVDRIDFYHDNTLQLVRQQWNQSIVPAACQGCTRKEGSNQWYKEHGYDNTNIELIRLDYWTGDTCNLRCAICGPKYSSAWKTELNLVNRQQTVNCSWKELDLSKLKFIHFNGGEPLLSKEHVQFLQAIPNKSQVQINYNTNGTILPDSILLELWGQFNLVQIDFSIDDINQRFEYQRYPAKWDTATKNLQWFIDNCPVNCMFAVNTTVSILNQHNLDNLSCWLIKNFSMNRLSDPIQHRQQPADGLLSTSLVDKGKVMEFLDSCDHRRGTDWKTTFPELLSVLY